MSFGTDSAALESTNQSDNSRLGLEDRTPAKQSQERPRIAIAKSSRVTALSADVRSTSTLAYPRGFREGRDAGKLEPWTGFHLTQR